MKKWTAPELETLSIEETAHNWIGIYKDGGYIGDGVISGHLSWEKPQDPKEPEKPEEKLS